MVGALIKAWLAHPLTRGLGLDDPRTTERRRRIVREKPFLRQIYEEWYQAIARALPAGEGPVLEVGSGAGFLSEYLPGLITSEILFCPGVRLVLDAARLPFEARALRGIVMTDVLHHLPQPRRFFAEAARAVRPGGVLVMIEPWVSPWSRLIYSRLHHEPFRPDAVEWEFPPAGPLSGANGALPWILFERDREQFEREFPEWRIQAIQPGLPFRYLVSGGVSLRSLMPSGTAGSWRWLERRLTPWMRRWAMFAEVILVRRDTEARAATGHVRKPR
jgi:SAM-dependent methyltransferase